MYRGTVSGTLSLYQTLGVVTAYTDSSVTAGTTYYYAVAAVNTVGEGSRSVERSATPTAPPPVVPGQPVLTATAGVGQVGLSWTTPSNGGSAITAYKLYRGTVSGSLSLYKTLGVVTTYTDTAVTAGTTYYYGVAAVNVVGEGARSAQKSAVPTGVPTAPRNVTAVPHSSRGVVLNWQAPSSTGGSSITGYQIFRSTTPGTETLLTTVGSSARTYRDASTTRNVRYYYVIRAVNAIGASPPSAEVTAIAR